MPKYISFIELLRYTSILQKTICSSEIFVTPVVTVCSQQEIGSAMTEEAIQPLKLFYSYTHADEALRNELEKHLSLLKRQGYIVEWHDRKILAGSDWSREINGHLATAHIILLLISSDFLASDYCYDIEVQRALERHQTGEAHVIPVILRHVDWEDAPFGKLQALPKNKKPVDSWRGRSGRDRAFQEIVTGIREVVKQGIKVTSPSQSPVLQKTKELWLDEGNSHFEAKRYREAYAAYKQVTLLDRNDVRAYCNAGIVLFHLKSYQKALSAFKLALQRDPHNAHVHYNMGIALSHLDRHQEAITAFTQAIQIEPKYIDAYKQRELLLRHKESPKSPALNTRNNQDKKFTKHAREVLESAQEEAQRFQHNYIGTEHILLGLLREEDGVAATVLTNHGFDLKKLQSTVEFIIGRGDRIIFGEIGLTPGAKNVIMLAVDEALRLNHHYIGTEHILLGLLREGEEIAAGVLESCGVNLENTRLHVMHLLNLLSHIDVPSPSQPDEDIEEKISWLNDEAQELFTRSLDIARNYEHNYIGTEHLLLCMAIESDGNAALILGALGADPDTLRCATEHMIRPGHQMRGSNMDFTPQLIQVIKFAFEEASSLDHKYIGSEHLLLGMLRVFDAIAATILRDLEIELADVRRVAVENFD